MNRRIKDSSELDEKYVLSRIVEGKTLGSIAHELNTFKSVVREIASNNGMCAHGDIINHNSKYVSPIQIVPHPIKINQVIKPVPTHEPTIRDEQIKKLFSEGKTQKQISEILGMSPQYINLLEKDLGIIRRKFLKSLDKKLMKLITKDVEHGVFSYTEILERYNINDIKLRKLETKYNFPSLRKIFVKKRDKLIVDLYTQGYTANAILNSNNKFLKITKNITAPERIYLLIREHGKKRHPHIKNRAAGECAESLKTFKLIEELKDVQKKGFNYIALYLNFNNKKTVTGTTFSGANVQAKYKQYKKYKQKHKMLK